MRPLIAASLALQFLYPLAAQGQARPPSTDASPPAAPAAAAMVGAEYPDVIDRAWRGVGMGISVAFAYEGFGRLQGRARVEHHRVLLALLRHLGDDRFALALSSQSPVGHAAILRALRAAAGPDSLGLSRAYPLTFGPRAPGDPSVEDCAAITANLIQIPDLRLDPFPDNPPVVLPPSAPPHVTVIVQVTASGRVILSGSAILLIRSLYPHSGSAIGASGGLFGLLGAALVLVYRRDAARFGQTRTLRMGLWLFLLIGLSISFIPGVSLAGHLGGFVSGPILGAVLDVRRRCNREHR